MPGDKIAEVGQVMDRYWSHRKLLDEEIRRAGGQKKFYRQNCRKKKIAAGIGSDTNENVGETLKAQAAQ